MQGRYSERLQNLELQSWRVGAVCAQPLQYKNEGHEIELAAGRFRTNKERWFFTKIIANLATPMPHDFVHMKNCT